MGLKVIKVVSGEKAGEGKDGNQFPGNAGHLYHCKYQTTAYTTLCCVLCMDARKPESWRTCFFFSTDINAWHPLLSKIPNICHFSAAVSSLMYSLFALVAFALFQL